MNQRREKIRIPKKAKIAFVCSGGAAKAGAYHLGVALALEEKGFRFTGGLNEDHLQMSDDSGRQIKVYVGSSAGSIICSYLASGYSLDQIFDTFLGKKRTTSISSNGRTLSRLKYSTMFSLKKDAGFIKTLMSAPAFIQTTGIGSLFGGLAKNTFDNIFKWQWLKLAGIFSTSGIEKYLREEVLPSNHFQDFKSELYIVATQLNHSKKVVFGKHKYNPDDKTVVYQKDVSVSDACAASTALPPVFEPWPIKNEKGHKVYYFDGEIRDTLSTHVAYDAGADLIIASYTHQPYHYSKEIGSLHTYGMPALLIQALYLLIEKKIQSSIENHQKHSNAIDFAAKFFDDHKLPHNLKTNFLEELEKKLCYKRGVDFIYIHPKPTDHQMFFGDHFNLSGKKMTEIVKLGFKNAIDTLRRYEFD